MKRQIKEALKELPTHNYRNLNHHTATGKKTHKETCHDIEKQEEESTQKRKQRGKDEKRLLSLKPKKRYLFSNQGLKGLKAKHASRKEGRI